jgi:hypothetical protein
MSEIVDSDISSTTKPLAFIASCCVGGMCVAGLVFVILAIIGGMVLV